MIPNPTSPQSIDLRSNPPNLARGVPSPKSSCLIPSPQAHHTGSLTGCIKSKGREGGKRGVQVCGGPAVAAEEREEGCGDAGEEEDERGNPEPHGRLRRRPRRAPPAAAAASRSLSLDRSVGEGDATGAAGEGDGGGSCCQPRHVRASGLEMDSCKEILIPGLGAATQNGLWAGDGLTFCCSIFIYLFSLKKYILFLYFIISFCSNNCSSKCCIV